MRSSGAASAFGPTLGFGAGLRSEHYDDVRERFFGVRQRQQIEQGPSIDAGPAQMIGDERGLDPSDQS